MLIDLVDEADRPVGVIRRGDVFDAGAGFRTVHVLIFSSRGELLLQQLADSRERNASKWGSSVAGYLFTGESYEQAAARKMRDEIVAEAPLEDLGQIHMTDGGASKFVHIFQGHVDTVEIGDPSQIKALRFWNITDIESRLKATPDAFTETFAEVFWFYRSERP